MWREKRFSSHGGCDSSQSHRSGSSPERFAESEEVLLPSASAALYRREMLEEIGLFDEDFFAYREEVDLAWRAQLRGWQCVYNPNAVAYHVHSYTSQTRKQQPKPLRRLQFRNRYLLMLKNDSLSNFLRHSLHILSFEILALGYVFLREPHLLLGYWDVLKLFPRMMRKRSFIRKHKSVSDDCILRWLT